MQIQKITFFLFFNYPTHDRYYSIISRTCYKIWFQNWSKSPWEITLLKMNYPLQHSTQDNKTSTRSNLKYLFIKETF